MNELVLGLALLVAVAAAARSTWSPCGHSMFSKLTPMGEASRGHRYGLIVGWFIAGALVGGLTLGVVGAMGAAGVSAIGMSETSVATAVALLAFAAAAVDARILGIAPPFIRRQVNEDWFGRYRGAVYALGFGWQLGVGVVTYVMTAAVFLTVVLAALTGNVVAAVGVCVTYGVARGFAILCGATITSPDRLTSFHRRFDAWGEPVRRALIVVQLAVAFVAGWAAAGPLVAVAGGLVLSVGWVATRMRGREVVLSSRS